MKTLATLLQGQERMFQDMPRASAVSSFLQSFQANFGIYLEAGHDSFLSQLFQFIIHVA
jgi:hypothetical protein